jgi:hypothetical protein
MNAAPRESRYLKPGGRNLRVSFEFFPPATPEME